MNNFPLVSIIIVANPHKSHFVRDAINTALAQTYPNKQIIVATYNLNNAVEEIVKSYNDVAYYATDKYWDAEIKNEAYKHASGKYIAPMAAEDMWMPEFLLQQILLMEKDNAAISFANWLQDMKYDAPYSYLEHFDLTKPYYNSPGEKGFAIIDHAHAKKIFLKHIPFPTSAFVFNKTLLTKGWDETLHFTDDWFLLVQLLLQQPTPVIFIKHPLWYKREPNIFKESPQATARASFWLNEYPKALTLFKQYFTKEEEQIVRNTWSHNLVEEGKSLLKSHHKPTKAKAYKLFFKSVLVQPKSLNRMLKRKG